MNQEQKDLAIKLINETVKYYESHPRSLSERNDCVYEGPKSAKCAFSRCCVDDAHYLEGSPASAQHMEYLLPEYQILADETMFWDKIQRLHDNIRFWTDRIFTTDGLIYVNNFKQHINDGLNLLTVI